LIRKKKEKEKEEEANKIQGGIEYLLPFLGSLARCLSQTWDVQRFPFFLLIVVCLFLPLPGSLARSLVHPHTHTQIPVAMTTTQYPPTLLFFSFQRAHPNPSQTGFSFFSSRPVSASPLCLGPAGAPCPTRPSTPSTPPNAKLTFFSLSLYLFHLKKKDEMGGEDRPVYKKVAVVEDFFDIIYREHVEFMSNSGGRPPTGKHAGQKRTYRAVSLRLSAAIQRTCQLIFSIFLVV
jgi:hypothetical protein